ncbi:hypothetical protein A0J61_11310, partial [Choanephora cucurbitarum]
MDSTKADLLLKNYFDLCLSDDIEPTFAHFIQTSFQSIRPLLISDHVDNFSDWLSSFKRYAQKNGFSKIKKGPALKAWETYVVFKEPRSIKRSHNTANVVEVLESFKLRKQKENCFVFEEYDVGKAMNDFAQQSMISFIKEHNNASRFRDDMNKWLAIHSIIKLNKHVDADLIDVYKSTKVEGLCKSFKKKFVGKPACLSSSIKVEILDLLTEFQDDEDFKKLKSELCKIVCREDGAVSRTIESLSVLVNKMTSKKKDIGEKKTENILEAVWGCIFKVTKDHDPHG